ncbi:MAG: T9SS type A sorting domain-containing protein [Bacteroidetes bacterium]|nr:T9SS type A sorting domain-containing protein [Bacteroidota bacterium]
MAKSVYNPNFGAVKSEDPNIKKFILEQNYPNPFNPTTTIKYSIPSARSPLLGGAGGGLVTLKVFDILGREVATLVNEYQTAGEYSVQFTTANNQLPSGVYFYQLKVGDYLSIKKMIILK